MIGTAIFLVIGTIVMVNALSLLVSLLKGAVSFAKMSATGTKAVAIAIRSIVKAVFNFVVCTRTWAIVLGYPVSVALGKYLDLNEAQFSRILLIVFAAQAIVWARAISKSVESLFLSYRYRKYGIPAR